jgi:hypothetical protein
MFALLSPLSLFFAMPIVSSDDPDPRPECAVYPAEKWQTFPEMLQGLHRAGILLAPEQLAAYLLEHGLPVDLHYVPAHLQEKACLINKHYQGDMARLEDINDPYWHPLIIIDGQEIKVKV